MKGVLAVDFGDRRTGLAGTDAATGAIVTPLPALRDLDDDTCARAIADLATDRLAEVIVLGLPLDAHGEEGPRAQRTRRFQRLLERHATCPVETFDERNTTDEAHELLQEGGLRAARRRQLADSVAALVILRRYLSG